MGFVDKIKEFVHWQSKCERRGHDMQMYCRSGYYPGGLMSVVTEVKQCVEKCKRCGSQIDEWETTRSCGYQSFSCPSDMADEIDQHSEENPFWYEYKWKR